MKFTNGKIFHIYNKGINYQEIFFKRENYFYFLNKMRKYISPNCDILAYSLIPNQFNFLIHANSESESSDVQNRNNLSEGIRLLLSTYCKGINIQENRTGSLFTQNTHSKILSNNSYEAIACFIYINKKAFDTGLAESKEEWEFSSYRDYSGFRNGTICNKKLTFDLLGMNCNSFREFMNLKIPNELINRIF